MTAPQQIQMKIDALALKRSFWRDMHNAITAPQTRDLMENYKKRIEATAADYVAKYDLGDPTDSISFAKNQEGRSLCSKILLELDSQECEKNIADLDSRIKVLENEKIKAAKAAKKVATGYDVDLK